MELDQRPMLLGSVLDSTLMPGNDLYQNIKACLMLGLSNALTLVSQRNPWSSFAVFFCRRLRCEEDSSGGQFDVCAERRGEKPILFHLFTIFVSSCTVLFWIMSVKQKKSCYRTFTFTLSTKATQPGPASVFQFCFLDVYIFLEGANIEKVLKQKFLYLSLVLWCVLCSGHAEFVGRSIAGYVVLLAWSPHPRLPPDHRRRLDIHWQVSACCLDLRQNFECWNWDVSVTRNIYPAIFYDYSSDFHQAESLLVPTAPVLLLLSAGSFWLALIL